MPSVCARAAGRPLARAHRERRPPRATGRARRAAAAPESFDLENMLTAASGLKYMRELIKLLEQQFEDPHDDFVRFFLGQTNPGARYGGTVKEQFKGLVRNALRPQADSDRVVTTEDELFGRSIALPTSCARRRRATRQQRRCWPSGSGGERQRRSARNFARERERARTHKSRALNSSPKRRASSSVTR